MSVQLLDVTLSQICGITYHIKRLCDELRCVDEVVVVWSYTVIRYLVVIIVLVDIISQPIGSSW